MCLIMKLPQTIAHEIGHNLNMRHDFDCKKEIFRQAGCDRFCATDSSQTCTNINSNMDYFEVHLLRKLLDCLLRIGTIVFCCISCW